MGAGGSAARKVNEKKERTEDAKKLDSKMGEARPAIKYKDVDKVARTVGEQGLEIADALEKEFIAPEREFTRADQERDLLEQMQRQRIAQMKKERLEPKPKGKKKFQLQAEKSASWRIRVNEAKRNVAWKLSVLQTFDAEFRFHEGHNFLQNMPFLVQESFGSEEQHFLKHYLDLSRKVRNQPILEPIVFEPKPTAAAEPLPAEPDTKNEDKKAGKKKKKSKKEREKEAAVQKAMEEAKKAAEEAAAQAAMPTEEEIAAMQAKAEQEYEEQRQKHVACVKDEAEVLQNIVNNINSGHMHTRAWHWPSVQESSKMLLDPMSPHKDAMISYFRTGEIAVQVLGAGAFFKMPDQGDIKIPMWNCDPYKLAERCLGQYASDHIMKMKGYQSEMKAEVGSMIESFTLGPRHLLAVTMAVSRICGGGTLGADAVRKLKLVLHVSAEMEQQVCSDLAEHSFFGVDRANVLIIVQSRLPGFWYGPNDKGQMGFLEDKTSPLRMYGTGFAFQQLTWQGEAYTLNEDSSKQYLQSSALEHLVAADVQWMCSNRLNDMLRLHNDHAIDQPVLMNTIKARELHGCAMSLSVDAVDSAEEMHRRGGMVLNPYEPDSIFAQELCSERLKGTGMMEVVEQLRREHDNEALCSNDRYVFHCNTLNKVLMSQRFTPLVKLEDRNETTAFDDSDDEDDEEEMPEDGKEDRHISFNEHRNLSKTGLAGYGETIAIYPFFDMCELSIAPKMRCVACKGTQKKYLELKDASAMEGALEEVYRQDSQLEVHKQLEDLRAGQESLVVKNIGVKTRFTILVFCNKDENDASLQAAQHILPLFIAGVDKVILVHVAKEPRDIPRAQKLLALFDPVDKLIKVDKHVMIQPPGVSLVDYMLNIIKEHNPSLVVMGSERMSRLNKEVQKGAPVGIGSIALAMAKKCRKPLYVFKAGSTIPEGVKPRTKWLVSVHQANMDLLKFAGKVMNNDKDTLVLGRVTPAPQDQQMSAKLLDAFEDQAVTMGVTPYIKQFHGSVAKKTHVGEELAKLARELKVTVLAVQVAQHLEPSESVLTMLKNAQCGVLIYKEKKDKVGSGRPTFDE